MPGANLNDFFFLCVVSYYIFVLLFSFLYFSIFGLLSVEWIMTVGLSVCLDIPFFYLPF